MQLLELFETWQIALKEFNDLLQRQVKAKGQTSVLSQIKVLDKKSQKEKSITRSSYNARLLHPHLWPQPLLKQFAEVLTCPELLTLFENQKRIIEQLPQEVAKIIKEGNTSNAFVIRLLAINESTFYAKQKDPKTWLRPEVERIEEIIETLKRLKTTVKR